MSFGSLVAMMRLRGVPLGLACCMLEAAPLRRGQHGITRSTRRGLHVLGLGELRRWCLVQEDHQMPFVHLGVPDAARKLLNGVLNDIWLTQ